MAKMNRRAKAALLALIILLSGVAAWATGGREDSLVNVDRLITNQRYDEAILILSDFIKSHPNRFDEAQGRMRRITLIRSAYNKSASALVEVLKNDPMNQEKKLAIIAELESYEKAPNPAVREFVARTKELALFTYNQAKFEDIMNQGRFLIDSRRFAEAARLYETGFALYRPEFNDSGLERSIIDGAFERTAAVSGEIISFADLGADLQAACAAYAEALGAANGLTNSEAAVLDAAWNKARSLASDFMALRYAIVGQGRALEASFIDMAAQDPDITDNSFLPFAFRLVLGRKTESRLEGVAGAVDALWINALGLAQSAIEQKLADSLDAGRAAYNRGDWNKAAAAFSGAAQCAVRGVALLSLWSPYLASELLDRSTPLGTAVLELKGADYARLQNQSLQLPRLAELCLVRAAMESDTQGFTAYSPGGSWEDRTAVLGEYERQRLAYSAHYARLAAIRAGVETQSLLIGAWARAGYDLSAPLGLNEVFLAMLADSEREARSLEAGVLAAAAGWEYERIAGRLRLADTASAAGRSLLEGAEASSSRLRGIRLRYPVRAKTEFEASARAVDAIRADLDAFRVRYSLRLTGAAGSAKLLSWTEKAQTLASQAEILAANISLLSTRASETKKMADRSRVEAEQRLAEAANALRSANFAAARDRLSLARDRFYAALDYEYDSLLEERSDAQLGELAVALVKAENDLVISETRQLLSRARSLYTQGEYEWAQSALQEARIRWSATHSQADFEIDYWLGLLANAMTIKSGRDIPVTNPSFPLASQLLAQARRHYDEGSALLSRRDRPGAVGAFALATQKLDEVKAIFPASQEARVIGLKIARLIDPDEFNKSAAAIFNNARASIDAGTALAGAYNDLKDLESAQPLYPGLRALLDKVEAALGLRPPVPGKQALAEAKGLLDEAQRLFDSGTAANLEKARGLLARALAADPGSQAMAALKDRIATRQGGDTVLVLPWAAEAYFVQASGLFAAGKPGQAREKLVALAGVFPGGLVVKKVAELDGLLKIAGY